MSYVYLYGRNKMDAFWLFWMITIPVVIFAGVFISTLSARLISNETTCKTVTITLLVVIAAVVYAVHHDLVVLGIPAVHLAWSALLVTAWEGGKTWARPAVRQNYPSY